MHTLLRDIGTEFDYNLRGGQEERELQMAASGEEAEAARKRLRIARLKKQNVSYEGINAGVLADPDVGDWQKEQTLKQI